MICIILVEMCRNLHALYKTWQDNPGSDACFWGPARSLVACAQTLQFPFFVRKEGMQKGNMRCLHTGCRTGNEMGLVFKRNLICMYRFKILVLFLNLWTNYPAEKRPSGQWTLLTRAWVKGISQNTCFFLVCLLPYSVFFLSGDWNCKFQRYLQDCLAHY